MAALPPWRQAAITPAATSYTSVNARRTLGAPPATNNFSGSTSATAQANNHNNNRTTFPDKLKQYVARTFEDCSLEAKPEVEAELKRIITDAFNEKIVWSVDWDNMALPQTVMQHRKAAERDEARRRISAVDVNSPTRSLSKVSLNESKKRKSNGEEKAGNKLADRIDKKAKHEADKLSQREKEMRAKRFAGQLAPIPAPPPAPMRTSSSLSDDVNNTPLVGRCQVLEKKFFRLTAAPNPDHVRPLYVLEKTLELLKKKWRTEQNYSYICDQFKSLRQDLTVQHIKNDFTVLVYEIHARIALEKGDLGEYNQCQSQLATLYSEGLKGHEEEFKAYRILYLLHTCNRADMNEILANLTPADKTHDSIRHALEVRSVLAMGNYHRFFKLYLEAPSMGGYLMDSFVARERLAALAIICKAYRPDIDIRFLTEELGFESDTECVTFLCNHGADSYIEQKSDDKGMPSSIRFQTSKAASVFEAAKKEAFKKVDIKGQM